MKPIERVYNKGLTGKNTEQGLTFELLPKTSVNGTEIMELICKEDIHIKEGIAEIDTGISINVVGNLKLVLTPKYGKRMDFVSVNPKYVEKRNNGRSKPKEQEQEQEETVVEQPIIEEVPQEVKIVPIPENTNPLPVTIYGNYEGTMIIRINCENGEDIIPKNRVLYNCNVQIYGIEKK